MYRISFTIALFMGLPGGVYAEVVQDRLHVDNEQVRQLHTFENRLMDLHKKQLSEHETRTTETIGGYDNFPDFYREVSYFDRKTGKLLSRVQWEREHPDVLHNLEVYVYDDKDRVIRDYLVSYLPYARNAPVQALINLHGYKDQLHAFRQFDVSTDVIYEYCNGQFEGKKRQIRLFEDDLVSSGNEMQALTDSPLYQACFSGIPQQLGKYIDPQ